MSDTEKNNAPLRDVFAAQGIAAVLPAIAAAALNLCAPEYLHRLLNTLHRFAENSPELPGAEKLSELIAAWFS